MRVPVACWQVMVISHSWGDNVFRNFMVWACTFDSDWVEKHVAIYSQIAGPTLGVPKSISSFLSGLIMDMHHCNISHTGFFA